MEVGHTEGFFPLTGNFTTQSEPAYCGPSSCMFVPVVQKLTPKDDGKEIGAGIQVTYDSLIKTPYNAMDKDELLECCSSKEDMKKNGITFDKFACLAKCHCDVTVKRSTDFTFEEFKKDVEQVTSRSDQFMVISFSRKTLGQTGDGHFSPIGAYNPATQMVLVLDTARYKYPSYWCSIETMYESMKPIDKETGRPRGYFLLSYDADRPPISLCKVKPGRQRQRLNETKSKDEAESGLNWSTLAQSFCKRIPENMWMEKPRTLDHVVKLVLRNVPTEYTVILANQSLQSFKATLSSTNTSEYIDHLLKDTMRSSLYPVVLDALYPEGKAGQDVDQYAAFATLFVLGSPRMLYTSLPRELQDKLDRYRKEEHMTPVVKKEVDRIAVEVNQLTKTFCTCGPSVSEQGNSTKDCHTP
ncbi:hypothetical protein EC973_006708 [Apophysomyces ossiformis]|uniref:glutathione gamma-glutamylcysteinyltransferase n=1 Tax=Apophysomyces ossiformis TaxID=679940 RepID=A0A8H7BQS2_9FUNG|nr:hypothetical protein EC973_006708 [Apophysomyces ossiformis]